VRPASPPPPGSKTRKRIALLHIWFCLQVFSGFVAQVVRAEEARPAEASVARSASFCVYSYRHGPSAAELGDRCEQLRIELQRRWLGEQPQEAWQPRCVVVLHGTRGSYVKAVGSAGQQTSGSSLLKIDQGRVLARRLDLLVDVRDDVPALSHELTHVILAECFDGHQPPRWLDEGLATMADSVKKRTLHHRDCREALREGTALRMVELLNLERLSSADQFAAFYGQSLLLVQFFCELGEPQRILEFAAMAREHGYDRALHTHFAINGVADLERQWLDFAARSRHDERRPSVIAAGHPAP
jgi:hypothetical protein